MWGIPNFFNLKLILILVGVVFFSGCTSGEFKDLGIKSTKLKLESEFRSEAFESLGKREKFLNKYVEANLNLTRIEPGDEVVTDGRGQLQLKVYKPTAAARQALREVMVKIEDWKDTSFNATDAMHLIYQKLNLPEGASEEEIFNLKFKKNSDWVLAE